MPVPYSLIIVESDNIGNQLLRFPARVPCAIVCRAKKHTRSRKVLAESRNVGPLVTQNAPVIPIIGLLPRRGIGVLARDVYD